MAYCFTQRRHHLNKDCRLHDLNSLQDPGLIAGQSAQHSITSPSVVKLTFKMLYTNPISILYQRTFEVSHVVTVCAYVQHFEKKRPFLYLGSSNHCATFSIATTRKKQLQSLSESYKANPSTDYNVLNLGFPACLFMPRLTKRIYLPFTITAFDYIHRDNHAQPAQLILSGNFSVSDEWAECYAQSPYNISSDSAPNIYKALLSSNQGYH